MLRSNLLKNKRKKTVVFRNWSGAVERIRTFDRLVNSQPLYRAEPRRHIIMLTALFRFNIVFKFSLLKPVYSICRTLRFAIAEKPL